MSGLQCLYLCTLTNVLLLPSNFNTFFSAVTCLNLLVYSSYWQFLSYLLEIFWGNNLSEHPICSFVFMLPTLCFVFLPWHHGSTHKSLPCGGLFVFTWINSEAFLKKRIGLGNKIYGTWSLCSLGSVLDFTGPVFSGTKWEDPARWSISTVLTTLKPNDSLALWLGTSHLDAICYIKRWLALLLVDINLD